MRSKKIGQRNEIRVFRGRFKKSNDGFRGGSKYFQLLREREPVRAQLRKFKNVARGSIWRHHSARLLSGESPNREISIFEVERYSLIILVEIE